jgi:hypothetical protein
MEKPKTTGMGGSQNPTKTYNEQLEHQIGNIIGRCSIKTLDEEHNTVYIIADVSIFKVELMEYILSLKNDKQ